VNEDYDGREISRFCPIWTFKMSKNTSLKLAGRLSLLRFQTMKISLVEIEHLIRRTRLPMPISYSREREEENGICQSLPISLLTKRHNFIAMISFAFYSEYELRGGATSLVSSVYHLEYEKSGLLRKEHAFFAEHSRRS
jgi:hypothetical protein